MPYLQLTTWYSVPVVSLPQEDPSLSWRLLCYAIIFQHPAPCCEFLWVWSLCYFSLTNCRKHVSMFWLKPIYKHHVPLCSSDTVCVSKDGTPLFIPEGGMKWYAHNEVKTCVVMWCFIPTLIEAIAGSLNPCLKDWTYVKPNNFGNILPWFLSSTSQACGTNANYPTSLEL